MVDIETIAQRYAAAAEESPHDHDGERIETERDLLTALGDELDPDDTVWILGASAGLHAMLAADVVGPERVAVVDEEADQRRRVADLLSSADLEEVTVAAPDARADRPASPTVVVVDDHAVESPAVTTALAGRLPGVRYLLVKSDDEATADRLRQGGFETTRVLGDDSSVGWETVVAGRRDPNTTVNPVVSRLFDGPPADAANEENSDEPPEADEDPAGPLALVVEGIRIVLAVVIVVVGAAVYGVIGMMLFLAVLGGLGWPLFWLSPAVDAWLMANLDLISAVGFLGGVCYFFLSAG